MKISLYLEMIGEINSNIKLLALSKKIYVINAQFTLCNKIKCLLHISVSENR